MELHGEARETLKGLVSKAQQKPKQDILPYSIHSLQHVITSIC
jgi:hypothetical protein